jgi:hypothetical protein
MIIDDHSDYKYIDPEDEKGVNIIRSELEPGRGEFLPYYYYLKNRIADRVCFIHDSVFINKTVDLTIHKNSILWSFETNLDTDSEKDIQIGIISFLKNKYSLLDFYINRKQDWKGCFGCMAILEYDFLVKIEDKYGITNIGLGIKNRTDRCALERVFSCILYSMDNNIGCVFGNIYSYMKNSFVKIDNLDNMDKTVPFTKVWYSR